MLTPCTPALPFSVTPAARGPLSARARAAALAAASYRAHTGTQLYAASKGDKLQCDACCAYGCTLQTNASRPVCFTWHTYACIYIRNLVNVAAALAAYQASDRNV
jgi:hypothetical protein